MSIKLTVFVQILALFAGISWVSAESASGTAAVAEPVSAGISGRISVSRGDKIAVEVYREPELSGTFIINSSGYMKYPLLGEVFVEGLTLDEISDYLTESLGQSYLVNPQVGVQLLESSSKSVTLLGQVAKPGNFTLSSGLTLARLISEAGGFSGDALAGEVSVTHTDRAGNKNVVIVNVDRIAKGDDPDYPLQASDIVFVDADPAARAAGGASGESKHADDPRFFITLLGQVSRPGNYFVMENLTLIRLIGQAGGFTPISANNRVRIVRTEEDGGKRVFFVDCGKIIDGRAEDIPVRAGDLIYVPESLF